MAIDVHSPKVTWASMLTICTLVFYSGGLTYQVAKNSDTDITQWRYINKNGDKVASIDKYMSRFELFARDISGNKESNQDMTKALIKLTATMENYNEKSGRDKEDRDKAEAIMIGLGEKINTMQADIAGIKAGMVGLKK